MMRNGLLYATLGVALVVSSVEPARAEEKAEGTEKNKVAKLFDKLDTNHDGKLSADELAKMHGEIHGKTPEAVNAQEFDQYMKGVAKDEGKIDMFKGALDLSIYTIIIFLILFGILRAFAWKPISEGLDARERSIAKDRHEADLARQEAAKTRDTLDSERAKANENVRQMMEKARVDAQATSEQELARGKAEIAAERERNKREVATEKAQAEHHVHNQGAQLAALLSAKVIKKNLTEEDHRALLDEALNEFRAAASTRKHDIESARA